MLAPEPLRRPPVALTLATIIVMSLVLAACGSDAAPASGDRVPIVHAPARGPSVAALSSEFGPTRNIWVERDDLRALPTRGRAWERLRDDARGPWGTADISDQNSDHDVLTLAGALYAVRMNDVEMRGRVVVAIESAIGTEAGGRTLALGRNLTGYVIAADLIGYRSPELVSWLSSVRHDVLPDGDFPLTLISTHERRPNNWGTHAGAARIAVARYLDDDADLRAAVRVFRGYLGDRRQYDGFRFGDPEWQADPSRPVPINPAGATKQGHVVDGAIVDDIRRCECSVTTPPPKEGYQWDAMQGIVTQATLLDAAGYDNVWTWSDSAIARAVRWLYEYSDYPADRSHTFLPYLIDAGLGTEYSIGVDARSGKSIGYTDWTHRRQVEVATVTAPAVRVGVAHSGR